MRPSLTFQVAPIELIQTLIRNGAILLSAEQQGDFVPRSALLALLANEFHERFETAVISASAAGAFALYRLAIVDDVWIHQR